jgi:hypothetical protein
MSFIGWGHLTEIDRLRRKASNGDQSLSRSGPETVQLSRIHSPLSTNKADTGHGERSANHPLCAYSTESKLLAATFNPVAPGLRAISAFEETVRVRDTKQVRPHFDRHPIVGGMRKRFIL